VSLYIGDDRAMNRTLAQKLNWLYWNRLQTHILLVRRARWYMVAAFTIGLALLFPFHQARTNSASRRAEGNAMLYHKALDRARAAEAMLLQCKEGR